MDEHTKKKIRIKLAKLSDSKSSILEFTKLLFHYEKHPCDSLAVVLTRMEAVSVRKRIPFLYLIDSFAQRAKKHKKTALLAAVEANIVRLIKATTPPEGSNTRNEIALEKVMRLWKKRGIMAAASVDAAMATAAAPPGSAPPALPPPEASPAALHASPPPHHMLPAAGAGALAPFPMGLPVMQAEPAYPAVRTPRALVVWELEDVLIVFQSLVDGGFARDHAMKTDTCTEIGSGLEDSLYQLLDDGMFYQDVKANDSMNTNLLALSSLDDGAAVTPGGSDGAPVDDVGLARRYRFIRRLYHGLETMPFRTTPGSHVATLLHQADSFTRGWLSTACQVLQTLQSRNVVHAVLSSEPLSKTVARVLLFNLAPFVPVDLIFSSAASDPSTCLERLAAKVAPSTPLCAVGKTPQFEEAAKASGFQFVLTTRASDLNGVVDHVTSMPPRAPEATVLGTRPAASAFGNTTSEPRPKKRRSRWSEPAGETTTPSEAPAPAAAPAPAPPPPPPGWPPGPPPGWYGPPPGHAAGVWPGWYGAPPSGAHYPPQATGNSCDGQHTRK